MKMKNEKMKNYKLILKNEKMKIENERMKKIKIINYLKKLKKEKFKLYILIYI
jgi:hypothetical protein